MADYKGTPTLLPDDAALILFCSTFSLFSFTFYPFCPFLCLTSLFSFLLPLCPHPHRSVSLFFLVCLLLPSLHRPLLCSPLPLCLSVRLFLYPLVVCELGVAVLVCTVVGVDVGLGV